MAVTTETATETAMVQAAEATTGGDAQDIATGGQEDGGGRSEQGTDSFRARYRFTVFAKAAGGPQRAERQQWQRQVWRRTIHRAQRQREVKEKGTQSVIVVRIVKGWCSLPKEGR